MTHKVISQNEIAKLLFDVFPNEQDRVKRLRYFQTKLKSGYELYRKNVGNEGEVFSADLFAFEVINRHNRRYLFETNEFKNTYFNHDSYIDSLVRETMTKFNTIGNRDYILQRKMEDIGDIDIITEQYLRLVTEKMSEEKDESLMKRLALKSLQKMVIGVDLVARGFIDESLILWRSFLENVTIVKIMKDYPNEPLETRFKTNKQDTLVDIGITEATSAHKDNLRDQTKKHLGKKSAKSWEILRYSWVGNLIKEQDYSSSTLRDLAGISDFNPHYNFTSLFVHERDIQNDDVKILRLSDYALMLYWKLFDDVLRPLLDQIFAFPKKLPLDKSEKDIRAYLKRKFGERLNELASLLY